MNIEIPSYKEHWNRRARTPEEAVAAVDGSTSEDVVRHTGRWAAEQVRVALDLKPTDRVLELGCGVGRIGRELAPHCGEWIGTDISEKMIENATRRLADRANVSFRQLSHTSLDMLDAASVDKAYSIAVFCHMDKEDLYIYLQELNRILKPGGLIFVETWNLAHPVGWRRWEYEPLTWAHADQTRRKDVARNQFCTPEEFALYVSHAGFDVLANYHESQSVQIVAGKALAVEDIAAQRARLEKHEAEIAYSPLYAELFGQFVDVIFGKQTATEMLAFIDGLGDAPEADLYRPYLLSLWRKNSALWGPAPD
ncbi:MAG: methyltransferase domain-containing protein [Xanthomonadales bacterium]|nr:methyltransferase domain-containing protein [Xanthomonadales bacterium]